MSGVFSQLTCWLAMAMFLLRPASVQATSILLTSDMPWPLSSQQEAHRPEQFHLQDIQTEKEQDYSQSLPASRFSPSPTTPPPPPPPSDEYGLSEGFFLDDFEAVTR